ncbi:MAG: hypothetical protein HYR60_26425 [Acidobacteria bacterium]|nr:hypothetical protein [Acidobacteriota bacterium]MBI3470153.1 hypothetical protein [Candidatus Solibacter usitatus]
MRIQINLASRPFRRDRPVIAAAVVFGLILTVLLALQISLTVNETRELKGTRAAIGRLTAEIAKLDAEQAKLEAVQRKPENAQVLERSVFLNSLLYRKAISWTRIFADLEQVLPHNVRVISIRPWLNPRNQVVLEMLVGSEQTEPLLQLILRLEQSDLFGVVQLSNRMPPSQNDPLYRYKVNVHYGQKF